MKYKTVTELKAEAMEYWQTISIENRIKRADWRGDKMNYTDGTIGMLYYGCGCIYIDKQGKLYTNKPKYNRSKAIARYY
uniref:Uncharacterized protein n=1 Tax=viral metagenome TaxID=1070528 RepID=A0A6M3LFK5_9ZZZZ